VETGRSVSELVQQALIDAVALELIYLDGPSPESDRTLEPRALSARATAGIDHVVSLTPGTARR
jgi:hypothetical protein